MEYKFEKDQVTKKKLFESVDPFQETKEKIARGELPSTLFQRDNEYVKEQQEREEMTEPKAEQIKKDQKDIRMDLPDFSPGIKAGFHEQCSVQDSVFNAAAKEFGKEKSCEYGDVKDTYQFPIQTGSSPVYAMKNLIPHVVEVQKGRQENKKFLYDTAQFRYDCGQLFATDFSGNVKRVGNFALEILEEKITVQEIVNEANEVVDKVKTLHWKMRVFVNEFSRDGWVESEKIFDFAWLRKISNERAQISSEADAKKLSSIYIQRLINISKHTFVTEYASSGWKWLDDGSAYYLTAEGAIGTDFQKLPVKAAERFKMITKEVSLRQIFQEFIGMRRIIPGNPGNAIVLQYYTIMSTLTSLYKNSGNQIEFCVALIGKTNTKKTSCGEIFSRIFNCTRGAVPDINFSATEAAIYEIMEKYADSIVMIDDMTPSENDANAREKQKKLESIIRSYGDRVPRRRSVTFASNASAREFVAVNGCALLTGEVFSGGKSSRSRVVILQFEDGEVDNIVLSWYQDNLLVVPTMMNVFLSSITKNVRYVMELIQVEMRESRRRFTNCFKLPRYVDANGAFSAITRIFSEFIIAEGLMSKEDAEKLLLYDRAEIFKVLQRNDDEVAAISPAALILKALKDGADRKILDLKRADEVTESDDCDSLLIEYNQFFCITAENLWKISKTYTDYRRIFFPYKSGKDIIEPLKAEGVLFIKQEGDRRRASHKLKLNHHTTNKRFLYMRKDIIEKIWDEQEKF